MALHPPAWRSLLVRAIPVGSATAPANLIEFFDFDVPQPLINPASQIRIARYHGVAPLACGPSQPRRPTAESTASAIRAIRTGAFGHP
jgi:hypothetical protein